MTQRQTNIPLVVWFLAIGLVVALVAVFVFNVAVSTVTYYGFLAFMIGSHFFMHSGHGGHAGHGSSGEHQHDPVSNAIESDKSNTNKHSGNTGGCH